MQEAGQVLAAVGAVIPGAQPLIGIGEAISTVSAVVGEAQAGSAASGAQRAQTSALTQAEQYAMQLANDPAQFTNQALQAEQTGVETLRSNMGGIPNPGAVIKDLEGQNVERALNAGVQAREGALSGGMQGLLEAGKSWAGVGQGASGAAGGYGQQIATGIKTLPQLFGGGGGALSNPSSPDPNAAVGGPSGGWDPNSTTAPIDAWWMTNQQPPQAPGFAPGFAQGWGNPAT